MAHGSSDFFIAASAGDIRFIEEAIQAYLEGSFDINMTNESGQTAIMLAVINDKLDVFEALMSADASLSAPDSAGNDVLWYALQKVNPLEDPMVEALLSDSSLVKDKHVELLITQPEFEGETIEGFKDQLLKKRKSEPEPMKLGAQNVYMTKPHFSVKMLDGDCDAADEAVRYYEHCMLHAFLESLGVRVHAIDVCANPRSRRDVAFLRDCGFYLPVMKQFVYPEAAMRNSSIPLKKLLKQHFRLRDQKLTGGYFEGGNLMYIKNGPDAQPILLHGENPRGFYDHQTSIPAAETTSRLRDLYAEKITVIGVTVTVDDYKRVYSYYHLDCFMQSIPSLHEPEKDLLILLNGTMLDSDSLTALQSACGDRLIDLKIEPGEEVLLNFLCIGNRIISSPLPEPAIKTLECFGYEVLTPEIMSITSPKFDRALTEKALAIMAANYGFEGLTPEKIHLAVPVLPHYLASDRGEDVTIADIRGERRGDYRFTLLDGCLYVDPDSSRGFVDFCSRGSGGVHCMTFSEPDAVRKVLPSSHPVAVLSGMGSSGGASAGPGDAPGADLG